MLAIIETAAKDWLRHGCARLGAALAYYSVFALGPLLLIIVAIAGLVFGTNTVRSNLSAELGQLIGPTGGKAIDAMLQGAASKEAGWLSAISGTVLLLVAAVGVVVQLKDAVNCIWETKAAASDGVWSFVRSYLVSFAGILALGFLLILSLIVSAALAALSKAMGATETTLWEIANEVISIGVLASVFALMFRYFPDTAVDWRDVLPASVATAVLFNIGRAAIGWYIGRMGVASTYGGAASVVVVLIWVYYSSQIVLFGAELAHATAVHRRHAQAAGLS